MSFSFCNKYTYHFLQEDQDKCSALTFVKKCPVINIIIIAELMFFTLTQLRAYFTSSFSSVNNNICCCKNSPKK